MEAAAALCDVSRRMARRWLATVAGRRRSNNAPPGRVVFCRPQGSDCLAGCCWHDCDTGRHTGNHWATYTSRECHDCDRHNQRQCFVVPRPVRQSAECASANRSHRDHRRCCRPLGAWGIVAGRSIVRPARDHHSLSAGAKALIGNNTIVVVVNRTIS